MTCCCYTCYVGGFLQSCPKNMHTQVFGCLLDLAENPKTLPHLSTWRGKDDISAAHLFCEKWREEEDLMGVKRDVTGAIMGECLGGMKIRGDGRSYNCNLHKGSMY